MPLKTKKAALADMLENLSESNFKKFCSKLLDCREEPCVRRRQVEGKDFLDIADVLVSTFTEDGAVKVALELLEDINCGDEAKELVKVTAGLDSKAGTSDTARPSGGATGADTTSGDQHFVDKHKHQLIDRVSNVDPILDHLLEKGVLQQESYDTIRALPTSQMKMRELFSSGLKDGSASKDIFYEILQRQEKCLIDDLNFDKTTTEKMLSETLRHLSSEELEDFCLHVELEKGVSLLSDLHLKPTDLEEIVELMVKSYSKESVKLTKNILKKMKRTDLGQRLLDSRQESKEDEDSLTQRVDMMTSVIDLLVEITSCLTEDEHKDFQALIRNKVFKAYHSFNPRFLWQKNHQEAACVIILTFGQNSVVKTMKFLKKRKRTGLVQKLLETCSSFKKKPSDEPRSVLFEKAATMAAVKDLLLEILQSLNDDELHKFKRFLLLAFENEPIDIPHFLRDSEDRTEIVDMMMRTYGRQSLDETREILKKLNRDDVMLMFPESSESKEKDSVDEHQPPKFETEDLEHILLETLRDLKFKEFEKFKWLLQLTYFQRSLRQIQWNEMKLASTPEKLVHLMVMNREPVEVTKEVLLDMNRTDLVERLLGTDSGFQEKHRSKQTQQKSAKTSLHWTLLGTLSGLSYKEHNLFKQHLLQITGNHHIQNAGRDGVVKLMVAIYGQRSVELTENILQIMNRTDLLKTLTETSSGFTTEKRYQPPNDSTMSPVHLQLSETLEELGSGDLEKFKHVLLYTKMREGLPKIPRDQIETADKDQLVKLMVEIYGQRCVEVTKDVLERIYRTDLVKKLSEGSSVSRGPFGNVEHEDCGQNMQDSGHWTKLDPEVKSADGDESLTYSLQSEAGCFECSVSSIRWLCKDKVSFQYKFCSWEEHIERMESLKYLPAGPLMNIKVIAGKLDAVYLPHWICIDSNTDLSGEFAVLHIDDCGDVVEQVSEVTLSHVKLAEPVFSPKGVLIKIGAPVKTNCSVLIYKTNATLLLLHVYLIPRDPGLQQDIDRRELFYGNNVIPKPPPGKSLKMRDRFHLSTDVDGAEICPEKVKLKYESSDQQYFEVCIRNPDRDFTLMLTQEKESTPVWRCTIRKDESQSTVHAQEVHFVDKHQCDLKKKVSNIEPILDKLLKEGVILQEVYDKIRATPTSQEKMRKLFSGPLKAGGQAAKDVFYKILEKEEPYLVADLKRKESGAGASWS